MNYRDCYQKGKSALEQAGIEEAPLDARLLLEYVCGTDRNDLLAHGERELTGENIRIYEGCIGERKMHIPLQHITGYQEFMGLRFAVNKHVLIPRQDTEILVEEVMRELQDGMRILDLCTGSGCILISLLYYSNNCSGLGIDISPEAVRLAEENTGLLKRKAADGEAKDQAAVSGEDYSQGRICFRQSDMFENVTERYDIIVSNPPYIKSKVIDTLMPEVRCHEPLSALDGHEDGMYFYRKIISEGRKYLARGGSLYLEIGFDQAHSTVALMEAAGYRDVRLVKDYAGLDRVVSGVSVGD